VGALTSSLLREEYASAPEIPMSDAEVLALVELAQQRGAQSIAIGSGRHPMCLAGAQALSDAWQHAGGELALVLDWPETAASWLRQATRFSQANADLWIMLGPPLGWAQMTRRLLWSTPWKPARALLAGGISDRRTLDLVGLHNLPGIAGTTRDGAAWHLSANDRIIEIQGPGS